MTLRLSCHAFLALPVSYNIQQFQRCKISCFAAIRV